MNNTTNTTPFSDVLLVGKGRTTAGIAMCLALSGARVHLRSDQFELDKKNIDLLKKEYVKRHNEKITGYTDIQNAKNNGDSYSLVIICGYAKNAEISEIIQQVENGQRSDQVIAVATDHIRLEKLQKGSRFPENIMVVNWSEPAHTSFFLEIVHNEITDLHHVSHVNDTAINLWGKDPYIIQSEVGIRGRLQTAMLREAAYLVEEGYANIEDIDRACRNDPGTYLPFAGHFQYMDLMGTYAYGVVMEKLNKELSNSTKLAPFIEKVLEEGYKGMTSGKGFYEYSDNEVLKWEAKMRAFGFEIRELMEKYPF